ncbi:Ribosomal protein L9/RNase H1, N-terminal [Lasallia pustulata]|uniref:Ribosomal protein L9/RNase H1, N-terminal n=1 Tax=Lasallia pustulata TaxID=136370 RepID=A0A1W5DDC7_9LECA|nr:Ribosomal protein L9/RNase H1, N-terminal [Lasallia pustulata]
MATATFMSPFRAPPCTACIRRLASLDISEASFPFHRQLRGKKKSTKQPHIVNVRLLRDIETYGRQGAVIPVAPGRMRNIWYPRGMAEYMTDTQLRGMNMRELIVERDLTFLTKKSTDREVRVDQDADTVIDVEMKLLAPQRATEILGTLLPPQLDFYRAPISQPPEPDKPRIPRSSSVSAAAAEYAAASEPLQKPGPVAIYGSVSTADIAANIKAVLAMDGEGARVVLGPEDITIVSAKQDEDDGEADRIKALGDFEIKVRVKGGEAVRRTVRVQSQE